MFVSLSRRALQQQRHSTIAAAAASTSRRRLLVGLDRSSALSTAAAASTVTTSFPDGPTLTSLNEHFHPTEDHASLRDMLRDYVAKEVSAYTSL